MTAFGKGTEVNSGPPPLVEIGRKLTLVELGARQLPFDSSAFYFNHAELTPSSEYIMIGNVVSGVLSTFALLDLIVTSVAGCRFVTSRAFRDDALVKWKSRPRSARRAVATLAVTFVVVITGVLLFFVVLTFAWLYRDVVVVRLSR